MANTKAIGVAYSDQALVNGSVDNSPIGATTPNTGAFTTLSADSFTTGGTGQNYFAGNVVVETNSSLAALRVTQTGSGNALLIEDSGNPDSTPVVIDAAGDVGIGLTTLGGYKLDIAPNAAGAALRLRGGSGGTSITQFTDFAASAQWGTLTAAVTSISLAHSAVLSFTTNTVERLRIGSTGTISLGAAPGSESLRVTPIASAVNYLNVYGGATGNSVLMDTAGSDANVNAAFRTKGTGDFFFYTGDYTRPQFRIAHTASAVNYLQVTGSASTFPTLSAQGSSANVAIVYTTKGTEPHYFQTNSAASTQFAIAHTASAVNYLQVAGAVTTGSPVLSAQGSDTNIDITLTPKGTGVLSFGTYTAGVVAQTGYITIKDAGGTTRRLLVG